MSSGGYLMQLGLVPYREAWALQRSIAGGRLAGCDSGHDPAARAPARRHARPSHGRGGRAAHPGRRRGRTRRDRPRGQVHLPRPGPARLLPDPRPEPARPRRQALRPRPRGGADPDARLGRSRRPADRRAHRRLAASAAAQDRLDRRPRLSLGDDARLRAQRRPRPRAVHGVDHGLRARGRRLHHDRARARPARDRRRRTATCGGCARGGLRPRSSRRSRPRTARASGRSRCTRSSRRARDRRPRDSVVAAGVRNVVRESAVTAWRHRHDPHAQWLAALTVVFVAAAAAFGHVVEDYLTGDPIVLWDVEFARWLHEHSSPALVRVFEVAHAGGQRDLPRAPDGGRARRARPPARPRRRSCC